MTPLLATSVLLFGLASPSPAQAPDVCKLFTNADVAAVLGAAPKGPGTSIVPGTCVWGAAGLSLTVSRTDAGDAETAVRLVDVMRTSAQPGEQIKDEPGLGQHALSRIGRYRRSADLQIAAGTGMWRFLIETADQKIDAEAALGHLRELARKALAAG